MHPEPQPRELSLNVLAILVLAVLISILLLHRYVFAVYVIQGSSMMPNLRDGDTALVNMLVWRLGSLDRGEIVLVSDGLDGYATKRIIGLPGERIEFRTNAVYINGRPLPEPYLAKDTPTQSEHASCVLGPNDYFVLGDNRADSYDSRIYGPISKAAIIGSYTRTFWACR